MALRHVGVSTEIQDLDTEKSKEAAACRRFFDVAREQVLRDFPWPFAKTYETLAVVASRPTVEWAYSYRYPANSVNLRRIINGSDVRIDTENTRVAYEIGRDAIGKLIYTDYSPATVEYTYRETNTENFPPDFVIALSFLLASYIAPSVSGGDPKQLGTNALLRYRDALQHAEANAANEEGRKDREQEAEMIRFREGGSSDSSACWP